MESAKLEYFNGIPFVAFCELMIIFVNLRNEILGIYLLFLKVTRQDDLGLSLI